MKKLITLILIFSLAIACLVSCSETENEGSVDTPVESSVATESETATESSLTVEESSEEENSEQSEETIEIPEFDINNVLYCSVCVGPEEGGVEVNDDVVNVGGEEESDYGFKQNFHNYKRYPKYDEEAFKTAYLYVIVILYSSDNNVPKEVLCDFLEEYGYVENKEKTTALGEIEGVEQATVGYLPWIMLQKLSSDCRSDEYKVYYSWLSKSCLGEDCQYYAPPLK